MPKRRRSFLPDDFGDFEDGIDKFEEQLKIISQCPVCNTKFTPTQSRLLADRPDLHLIYLHCKKCLNSVVATIRFDPHGITSIGMVTDLSYEDVLRIKDGEPVNIDDVLEAHEMLRKPDWHKSLNK